MDKTPDTWLQALMRSRIREAKMKGQRAALKRFPATRWMYPWAVERQYSRYIKEFMKELFSRAFQEVRTHYPTWVGKRRLDSAEGAPNSWRQIRQNLRDQKVAMVKGGMAKVVTTTSEAVNKMSSQEWQKFVKAVGGQEFYVPENFENALAVWEDLNYELLDSLGDYLIDRINTIVSNAVLDGDQWEEVADKLESEAIPEARADFIARDQVGKLNGTLAKGRQVDAGVDEYEWDTSMDERVRDTHETLQGKICRWDDPEVYKDDDKDEWQQRDSDMFIGHPGDDYQCRCVALPHLQPLWDQLEEEENGSSEATEEPDESGD